MGEVITDTTGTPAAPAGTPDPATPGQERADTPSIEQPASPDTDIKGDGLLQKIPITNLNGAPVTAGPKVAFVKLKLEEASEESIAGLGEDEEVVLLMPAQEVMIAHGPKRTVLYRLCGSVAMTEKINDSLEGEPRTFY